MIVPSGSKPNVCANCAHSVHTDRIECRKAIDAISGDIAPCAAVRNNADLCGPEGNWFERREIISTIVERAPITLGKGAKGNERLSKPQPVAESKQAKAYRPDDPNVQEWIKDGKPQK